jgi:ATP phosphoribosyltransferase regulatory subunit
MVLDMDRRWADRPPGMRDVYPNQAKRRRQLEDRLLLFFEQRGYEMVSTGAFEYVDTLLRGRGGQDAAEWVQWFDASGRALALRPDMTPSIARMAAPLVAAGRTPIRWCYAERVYRRSTDPASLSWVSGRAAESTQVGVEWIGAAGPDSDCELLALCQTALGEIGVHGWQLVVSHAQFAPAYLAAAGVPERELAGLVHDLGQGDYVAVRAALEALGCDPAVLTALSTLDPFHPDAAPFPPNPGGGTAAHLATLEQAWAELTGLAAALSRRGAAGGVSFDLALHRDPAYYTGIVFEVFAPGVGAPVAYGGRYDRLLEQFGAGAPAIGFTFELERLLAALTDGDWLHAPSGEA